MLGFFRRFLSSWMSIAILAIVMIAFIVTGVGTPGGGLTGGGGVRADAVADVGGTPVTVDAITTRVQSTFRSASEQQPGLTMQAFLAEVGGLKPIIDQYIGAQIISSWAARHGLAASERLIGGEIGSIPAFRGPTGQFDERQMNAVLDQQRMTYATLHQGIHDDLIRRQVIVPLTTGVRAPNGLLSPYAKLLLDKREGAIGLVPASTAGIAQPTDAEVAAWYKANIGRYSLAEQRVLHYALIGPETVNVAPPTEAEIAAAYKADAAKYAASETRAVSQVVLPDEAAAKALAAKIAASGFAKATAAAGFAASDIALGDLTRDALSSTTSPAIAAAAFALPANGTTAPTKSSLGWAIVHVDAIKSTPARSLDQVRGEITAALAKKKAGDAAATEVETVQDAISDGASFNDVVKKQKLQVITTPPLLANGTAPTVADFKPDATSTALMKAAADMGPDDEPTVESVGPDQHYALLSVANVVPAAPIPLAQIKARVTQDVIARRAGDRAKAAAQAVFAKVKGGQAMAAAFAAAKLPAPQPIAATQVQLAQAGNRVPIPVRTMFGMTPGKTEMVAAGNGSWFIVHLDRIEPGDTAALPAIIAATKNELSSNIGEEYAQQFVNAARVKIKVKRNPAAITKLDQQLRGGPDAAGQ